jgi:hypothetical protein
VLTWQMDRLVEDLAYCSAQLAALLQEFGDAIMQAAQAPMPNVGPALQGVAYAPRVRSLVVGLRRAEGWLHTIDQETGAHATLPGFTPGAPPIETQLGLE